jgi:hypothetical protein
LVVITDVGIDAITRGLFALTNSLQSVVGCEATAQLEIWVVEGGGKLALKVGPREETRMVRQSREDHRADAIECVFRAYDELTKTIGRSEGACIDDLQAAVEYLLDEVKVARKDAQRLICRAKPLLRAASAPRQSQ